MQHKDFDQIYDLLAIRIKWIPLRIVMAFCATHTYGSLFRKIQRLHCSPKPNMYQSLHTTVIDPSELFEIQIRTWEMHRTAEYGIAAHWKYKEGRKVPPNWTKSYVA